MGKKSKKKTHKGKIEKRYISDSMDIFAEEDYYSENEEANSQENIKDNSNKSDQDPNPNIVGKLNQFFSLSDTKDLMLVHQADKIEGENICSQEHKPKPYKYIQMKLDLEHISLEFEKELEEFRLSGIKIRKANESDLEIFVKLYNRAFMRGIDPWSPATIDQFRSILQQENTVVLIASTSGEDVGFIITELEGDNNEIGIISGLGVDPRWQRQGIARYLGIASWDYFKNMDVEELRCEVYEKNIPSYRLIKNLHFKEIGIKTYYF